MNKSRRLAIVRYCMLTCLLAAGVVLRPAPACPQEDSCNVDYRNGGWYVQTESGSWSRVTK